MDRRLGTILILRHQADWERLSSTRHFAHAHKCNVCARGVGIKRKMAELQLDAEESSTGGSSNLEILLVDEEPRNPSLLSGTPAAMRKWWPSQHARHSHQHQPHRGLRRRTQGTRGWGGCIVWCACVQGIPPRGVWRAC